MIDLRCGDCLGPDGLPSLNARSVDVIITDPPFDQRTHRAALEGGDWRDGKRKISKELPFAPLSSDQIPIIASHFVRVCKGWILIFVAERQFETWACAIENAGGRYMRLGAGVRSNPRPQMSGDRPALGIDPILIAWADSKRSEWNGGGKAGVWKSPAARWDTGGKTAHPTQKPLALMRDLLGDFSNPSELVCDPFAGSGTTAVACKELGRRFVGWEIDPSYHALACARVLRTGEPPQLEGPSAAGAV